MQESQTQESYREAEQENTAPKKSRGIDFIEKVLELGALRKQKARKEKYLRVSGPLISSPSFSIVHDRWSKESPIHFKVGPEKLISQKEMRKLSLPKT